MTSTPAERTNWNPCQNPRCNHRYDQHEPHGRCTTYHCRCSAWRPLTEQQYQEGRR